MFPGGCFFASVATELDTRPGPVRDRVAAVVREWAGLLELQVAEAQRQGELDPSWGTEIFADELPTRLAGAARGART